MSYSLCPRLYCSYLLDISDWIFVEDDFYISQSDIEVQLVGYCVLLILLVVCWQNCCNLYPYYPGISFDPEIKLCPLVSLFKLLCIAFLILWISFDSNYPKIVDESLDWLVYLTCWYRGKKLWVYQLHVFFILLI